MTALACGRSVSVRCLMFLDTPTTVIHCGSWSGLGAAEHEAATDRFAVLPVDPRHRFVDDRHPRSIDQIVVTDKSRPDTSGMRSVVA